MPHPYEHQESQDWIRKVVLEGWRSGSEFWLGIVDAATDEFLGEVGLRVPEPKSRCGEIGEVSFVVPSWWLVIDQYPTRHVMHGSTPWHHRHMDGFGVVVGAGTLRSSSAVTSFAHRWTDEGVTVDAAFTGGHLLHLAVAGCVLNDVYREAAQIGLPLRGVRVGADGAFDEHDWHSTGIKYWVEIDCDAEPSELDALLRRVDAVAEIPKSIRAGAGVERVSAP